MKTTDGKEHTLHFAAKTAVRGTEVTAKDTFHGLKEGSEVVAHDTAKGTEVTVDEVDKVGKDGMRATEGTISAWDRGSKKLVVKTADGTEQTFKLSGHAAEDAGRDVGNAAEKVAHFFRRLVSRSAIGKKAL